MSTHHTIKGQIEKKFILRDHELFHGESGNLFTESASVAWSFEGVTGLL
jgi:hypothetical protein